MSYSVLLYSPAPDYQPDYILVFFCGDPGSDARSDARSDLGSDAHFLEISTNFRSIQLAGHEIESSIMTTKKSTGR